MGALEAFQVFYDIDGELREQLVTLVALVLGIDGKGSVECPQRVLVAPLVACAPADLAISLSALAANSSASAVRQASKSSSPGLNLGSASAAWR
jgi:hypothetical protein